MDCLRRRAAGIVMNVLILICLYGGLLCWLFTRSALTDCRARSVPSDTQIYDPHGGTDQTGICVVSSFYQHLRC